MAIHIGRREFVATIGGAALVWPLAAGAQQSAIPVAAFPHAASLETQVRGLAEFHKRAREIGSRPVRQ